MLIIFDLDDTLIDTSGSILPFKLKYAFDKMLRSGLKIKDPENQFKELVKLNESASSAKEALELFLKKHDSLDYFFDIGISAIYHEFNPDIKVLPRKSANKILNILKKNHKLALVTVGNEEFQCQKLKNAGIDFSIFSMIEVTEKAEKKPLYEKIIKFLKVKARETIVCGDKVIVDLIPAKQLDCITIHMQYGRGLNNNAINHSFIDYKIKELEELTNIINKVGG